MNPAAPAVIPNLPSTSTMPDPPAAATKPKQPKQAQPVSPSKFHGIRSTIRNNFLQKVLHSCDRVLQYESTKLQLQALNCIPLEELKTRVEKSIRNIQVAYKKKEIPSEHQNYQELMLYSLITWFKTDFFSWVNSPSCPECQCEGTMKETRASPSPGIDRIEVCVLFLN